MLNLDHLFDLGKYHSYVNWHLTTQNKARNFRFAYVQQVAMGMNHYATTTLNS